jgi:2-C-methyl-D-erythritol 4-phosphate cytidylyltransferase/2-C-methyl-D-erythritol 2,4-cyclodiphosphate synthase
MSPAYWLVVPAAGTGRRSGADIPKQYRDLLGRPLLEWALRPFAADARCRGVALALAGGDQQGATLATQLGFSRVLIAAGGAERCHSVLNALQALLPQAAAGDWVLVHDAARPCVTRGEIDALVAACCAAGSGGLLALPVSDTVKRSSGDRVLKTVPRAGLWRALTPQMFRLGELRAALQAALAAGRLPTDEAEAMEASGATPLLVPGSASNLKVTGAGDFALAAAALGAQPDLPARISMRTGFGTDVHAFGTGDHVMLGGVRVPHDQGVVAHSDGDVLLHALCDALLGAAGLGDIGMHFPDSDPRWRGAASAGFVTAAVRLLRQRGLRPLNADLTLLAEAPRIGPHRAAITANIATLLELPAGDVNLKATTTEGLGFIGRREGLAANAVVTLTAL